MQHPIKREREDHGRLISGCECLFTLQELVCLFCLKGLAFAMSKSVLIEIEIQSLLIIEAKEMEQARAVLLYNTPYKEIPRM